jgi:hypothetical protein
MSAGCFHLLPLPDAGGYNLSIGFDMVDLAHQTMNRKVAVTAVAVNCRLKCRNMTVMMAVTTDF